MKDWGLMNQGLEDLEVETFNTIPVNYTNRIIHDQIYRNFSNWYRIGSRANTWDIRLQSGGYGIEVVQESFQLHDHELVAVVENGRDSIGRDLFLPVRGMRQREDGTYTQLPEICIEELGTPIDLGVLGDGRWTIQESCYLLTGRGAALRDGEALVKNSIHIDGIGSISLFDKSEEAIVSRFEEATGTERQKVIRLKSFFKGSGEVDHSIENQTPKQIKSGQRLFLFKHSVWMINKATMLWEQRQVISIGTFDNAQKIRKYVKARRWFVRLLSSLRGNGLRFFRPEEWREYIRERGPGLTKYWAGLPEIIEDDDELSRIQEVDAITSAEQNAKVTDREFKILNLKADILNTEAGQRYTRAKNAYGQLEAKVQEKRREAESSLSNLQYYKREQEDVQRRIESLQNSLSDYDSHITEAAEARAKALQQVELLEPTLPTLKINVEAERAKYNSAVDEYMNAESSEGQSFTKKLKKTGIIVSNIMYHTDRGEVDASEAPELLKEERAKISKICFVTTKPLAIYVDRHRDPNTKKIVMGGPYEVQMSFARNGAASLSIRLASHDALFGIQDGSVQVMQVKIHPHTSVYSLIRTADSYNDFIQTWQNPCLGNAAPAIAMGATKNNPKIAIMGALAWLTSSYSGDSWGRTWSWFPKPSEVDPEGNFDGSKEAITTEDVVSALVQHLNDAANTTTDTEPAPEVTENDIRDAIEEIRSGNYSPYPQAEPTQPVTQTETPIFVDAIDPVLWRVDHPVVTIEGNYVRTIRGTD
jgi:hypothetical protein